MYLLTPKGNPEPLYSERKLPPKKKGIRRVWFDGCFDLIHYGHFNALRQAKTLGDELVAGVHSKAEIELHKGPTVYREDERAQALRCLKWVDHVVVNAPYRTRLWHMKFLEIDIVIHGDDVTFDQNGEKSYKEVIEEKMLQFVRRTPGISTTEIIKRFLHFHERTDMNSSNEKFTPRMAMEAVKKIRSCIPQIKVYNLKRMLDPSRLPDLNKHFAQKVVVYLHEPFFFFHVSHLMLFQRAKRLGDILLVGLPLSTPPKTKDVGHVFSSEDRLFSLLSCDEVDYVVLNAPVPLTSTFLRSLRVDIVCTSYGCKDIVFSSHIPTCSSAFWPRYQEIDIDCNMHINECIDRIRSLAPPRTILHRD